MHRFARQEIARPLALLALTLVAACARMPRAETTSAPAHLPPALHLEGLAFDADRGRLVLFGGSVSRAQEVIRPTETWEWDGRGWRVAVPEGAAGPVGRVAHGMAYDPVARRTVLYGGVRDTAFNTPGIPLCDTWFLDGRGWTPAPQAGCPTNRAPSTAVWDAARQAMLLVEGPPGISAPGVREPEIPLRIWRWERDGWRLADSAGPRRVALEPVAYDRARSVLVVPVFDGPDAGVWEWGAAGWRRAPAATTPGPSMRTRHALAYDAALRRVVLVGGRSSPGREMLGDAWTWDGTSWAPLPIEGANGAGIPGPRASAALVEDPTGGRLLYFGGVGSNGLRRDLWSLRGGRWRLESAPPDTTRAP